MTTPDDFLASTNGSDIDWKRPVGTPITLATEIVVLGEGAEAFEVALAKTIPDTAAPKAEDVRRLWAARWGRRAAPVALVVTYRDPSGVWKASVCGTKDDPAVIPGLDLDQVERICAAALSALDPANAERTFHRLLVGQKDALVAGLTNVGLFASYELRTGVPRRADYTSATSRAMPLLTARGQDLIRGLGYTLTPLGSAASILSANGAHRAVAVLLDQHELFDRANPRFNATSPVAQGMAIAAAQNLPWLLITRGTQIRLYPSSPDVGVGRKGQTETYAEIDLALLANDDAAFLDLIFSAAALSDHGTATQILEASADHAAALGARLRTRVYEDVVPALAIAVAVEMNAESDKDLAEAYHRTLTILFRLLFVAYAEDRGLLPYQRNPRYTRKALKTLAREFTDAVNAPFDEGATDRWVDLLAVWKAIDDGNIEWGVPAYNGGLFAADESHLTGHAIAQMTLNNKQIGPALRALLIDTGEDGTLGPVDFRSLSVREFGTIYEGLLESSLSIAPTDLTVDPKSMTYLPAKTGDDVKAAAGEVYFHNASGARKSTGSYFTKKFAVEHLLDTALEPALTTHLDRISALLDDHDTAAAAEAFFDFRVADLAMGSGHFLVAAIDRIEKRFATFLATRPIAPIDEELNRLAMIAREALGSNSADIEIEPSGLLRRQIARRCIYGVDLNLMAVELARLGIWIHTFVPGLPMSALDHGLIAGNSLTGIGTLDEVLAVLEPHSATGQYSLIGDRLETELGTARQRLARVARTSEANKREVREASREYAKALLEAADAKAVMDAAIAVRLGVIPLPFAVGDVISAGKSQLVAEHITELGAVHLPYRFPEVFLRDRPGFDVTLGNPPWDKVMAKEDYFWAGHFPGFKALAQKEAMAAMERYRTERPDLVSEFNNEIERADLVRGALLAGPYPGLGSGHPDLFKAFSWRNWQLVRQDGYLGIVLPRAAFGSSGGAAWRNEILDKGEFIRVTMLMNTGSWVFDDVHQQFSFALTTVRKGRRDHATISVDGPYRSADEYRRPCLTKPRSFPVEEFRTWTEDATLPLFPGPQSVDVFAAMRAHPGVRTAGGGLEAQPVQGDFNSTTDKPLFDFELDQPHGDTPVFKGASFRLWEGDTGAYYAWTKAETVAPILVRKRARQKRTGTSAFYGSRDTSIESLPMFSPRIAYRRYCNQENARTMVTALIPGHAVLVDGAPYLVFRQGDATDEAFVLGVLSSIPLDWYVRRIVERNITFDVFNTLPIPRPDRELPLRLRVVEVSGRLAAADHRYKEWAKRVGVDVGSVTDEDTKADLVAELDALVSLLYGLDRAGVEHIFATFHRGWSHQQRLDAVLAHFDAWKATVAP